MTAFIWNTVFFLIALGILVAVHEFGHFWVARRCGVKVERFSIGFGKTIWSRVGKDGTEYVLSLIPLGGYVKMLDERVAPVAPADRPHAFNQKSIGQRSAIVAAGPVANFILAVLVLWLMYLLGVSTVKPVLGELDEQSIAAKAGLTAGLEITAVDDEPTLDWEAVNLSLVKHLGDDELVIYAKANPSESPQAYTLDTRQWQLDRKQPSPLEGLGLAPYRPQVYLQVAEVLENGAAERAGVQVDDKLLSLDDETLQNWQQFVEKVQTSPNQLIELTVERNGQHMVLPITPDARKVNGNEQGYVGLGPRFDSMPESYLFTIQYGPIDSLVKSLEHTWRLTVLTLDMLGKLITGKVSVENLSGPISIAKGAGATAGYGLVHFLSFLALISVNLGIINLFPLPVLDGGHLVFFAVEKVIGKPVSERVQEICFRIGASLLVALMALAIFNDVMRLQ